MNKVEFKTSPSGCFFSYSNDEGDDGRFDFTYGGIDFHPTIIGRQDVNVELLINPIFNLERDVYCIRFKRESRGYVFPVSIFDGDYDLSDAPNILIEYVYMAFYCLLERLPGTELKNQNVFSGNFEGNVCVCVLDLRKFETREPLHLIIHSLRKYQYSYFTPKNQVRETLRYSRDFYALVRDINVIVAEPLSYRIDMVDMLLRELPTTSNYIHRFVILYQFIELLIEVTMYEEIYQNMDDYCNTNMSSNDFIERIANSKKERYIIRKIIEDSQISNALKDRFITTCSQFLDIANCPTEKNDAANLLYTFRNQMTHSFRKLRIYEGQLVDVIQCMEMLVLEIVEKYNFKERKKIYIKKM